MKNNHVINQSKARASQAQAQMKWGKKGAPTPVAKNKNPSQIAQIAALVNRLDKVAEAKAEPKAEAMENAPANQAAATPTANTAPASQATKTAPAVQKIDSKVKEIAAKMPSRDLIAERIAALSARFDYARSEGTKHLCIFERIARNSLLQKIQHAFKQLATPTDVGFYGDCNRIKISFENGEISILLSEQHDGAQVNFMGAPELEGFYQLQDTEAPDLDDLIEAFQDYEKHLQSSPVLDQLRAYEDIFGDHLESLIEALTPLRSELLYLEKRIDNVLVLHTRSGEHVIAIGKYFCQESIAGIVRLIIHNLDCNAQKPHQSAAIRTLRDLNGIENRANLDYLVQMLAPLSSLITGLEIRQLDALTLQTTAGEYVLAVNNKVVDIARIIEIAYSIRYQ